MGAYDGIRVEAQRSALFETPIVSAHLKEGERLMADLEHAIRKRMAEDITGVQRSNIGGWHSDTQMLQWGGEAARELFSRGVAIAQRLSNFSGAAASEFNWVGQMWANVSRAGSSNHMHVHPGNLWSGVLYLNLGGKDKMEQPSDDVGGSFYFEDPRFPLPVMHNTRFRFVGQDGQPMAWQPEIKPRRGDILMFPAWLKHGVRPYTGSGERISIAFNIDALSK